MFGLSLYEKLKQQHIQSRGPSLAHTRDMVLFHIIFISTVIGFLAYVPSLLGALYVGFYDIALLDTLFYIWILILLYNPNIGYRQKAIGFIVPLWILSVYLIIRFGVHGAGFLWLFVAPVLTGILLGLKEGMIALSATVFFLLFGGILMYYSGWGKDTFGENPLLYWSIISGNTILLSTLIMITSTIMISTLSNVIEVLNRKVKALSDTEDATIETFAKLAEFRDMNTGGHIERTKEYVLIIADTLQKKGKYRELLTDEYVELLYKSAPLHDIGKIGIPDSILLKRGKLTVEEMEVMKKHTIYGRDILLRSERKLGSNSFLKLAAEIAYTHQERWDGSGYPQGLRREEIPLSGRIMAVADVYDALRSDRPYKKAMDHEKSIAYLKANGGVLFDPYLIELLPELERKFLYIYEQMRGEGNGSLFSVHVHPVG
jgi:HD-GYP domain-containing protein (c-di-GMP phosphodiesterase class II)